MVYPDSFAHKRLFVGLYPCDRLVAQQDRKVTDFLDSGKRTGLGMGHPYVRTPAGMVYASDPGPSGRKRNGRLTHR